MPTKFIEFLKRLMTGAQRPVFLIVDGHPTHRAVKVKKFVANNRGQITLVLFATLLTGTESG